MNSVEDIEKQIEILNTEFKEYGKKADEAYAKRDFPLENKYQEEIETRRTKISELKTKLIELKYTDFDLEKEIEKLRKQHDWGNKSGEQRCSRCAMKNLTTFQWKVDGARENWQLGFKSDTFDILKGMECRK